MVGWESGSKEVISGVKKVPPLPLGVTYAVAGVAFFSPSAPWTAATKPSYPTPETNAMERNLRGHFHSTVHFVSTFCKSTSPKSIEFTSDLFR